MPHHLTFSSETLTSLASRTILNGTKVRSEVFVDILMGAEQSVRDWQDGQKTYIPE
jgi:hypothetical protein